MPDTRALYLNRFRRVLAHIDTHLGQPLDLATLAAVADFSPFHFHRQFAALFDITVDEYVRLRRMKCAAYRLAFREGQPIVDIALDGGYASPEAFARAFRKLAGQSPSEFRRAPDWSTWHATQPTSITLRELNMPLTFNDDAVRLVHTDDIRVAVLRHHGDPARIGDSLRRFIDWRRQAQLPPRVSATYNLLHDDPELVATEDYRFDLCAATSRPVSENVHGVVEGVIEGGRCAVLRHTGSDDGLAAAVRWLYGDWLPRSGEVLRDFPLYLQRVRFFPEVPEHEAVSDIFLPLR